MQAQRCALAAFVLAMLLLVSATPILAATTHQSTPPAQGRTTDVANLRAGPGTTFAKTGSLAAGTIVTIAACNDVCDWYKLDRGEWIAAFLVEPVTAPAAAPAATTPSGLLPRPTGTMAPAVAATPVPTAAPAAEGAATGPVANGNGNLRAGPGTNFAKAGGVASGQALAVVGKTSAEDWYKLADGNWIVAFLVDGAPADVAVVVDLPTAPPTVEPTPVPAQEAVGLPAAGARDLEVSFINPHYNCEQSTHEFEYTPGVVEKIWVYRNFQVDLYIKNNGSTPIEPPWMPARWIITNGSEEMVNDMSWEWLSRNGSYYAQPTLQPGQQAGWTWIVMPVASNEWVKAVEYDHNGQTYRQEFDLGPYGNAYNYVGCGVERNHEFYPTPTPHP